MGQSLSDYMPCRTPRLAQKAVPAAKQSFGCSGLSSLNARRRTLRTVSAGTQTSPPPRRQSTRQGTLARHALRCVAALARVGAMTLTKPVVVPFEGPLTKGNFVRTHGPVHGAFGAGRHRGPGDESNGEVKAHCINPGRMEAFVDPGATIWARRAPENGPKRKTDWTWELIERDGVICSTKTRTRRDVGPATASARWRGDRDATSFPHLHLLDGVEIYAKDALTGFTRLQVRQGGAKALTGFTDYKSAARRGPGTKSRCDFFVEEKDGTHHYVEVKNCHATYPDEEVLRGWGYFPDSVSERAARHCRELAALASKPKTKCTVIIVASRADATKGIRPSDYHDPGFCAAAAGGAKGGRRLPGAAGLAYDGRDDDRGRDPRRPVDAIL